MRITKERNNEPNSLLFRSTERFGGSLILRVYQVAGEVIQLDVKQRLCAWWAYRTWCCRMQAATVHDTKLSRLHAPLKQQAESTADFSANSTDKIFVTKARTPSGMHTEQPSRYVIFLRGTCSRISEQALHKSGTGLWPETSTKFRPFSNLTKNVQATVSPESDLRKRCKE